jgi:transglutaminase-like putative cysteine protease
MRCHKSVFLAGLCSAVLLADSPAQSFPSEWGPPPVEQMADFVRLPYGFGQGSSTLAGWIEAQAKFIGFPKSEEVYQPLPPAGTVSTQAAPYPIGQPSTGSAPTSRTVDASPVKMAAKGLSSRFMGSKQVDLSCDYKGKTYTAELGLGNKAYKQYLGRDQYDWSKKDRSGLLTRVADPGDYGVTQLANAINRHAREQGLNDNEKAELAVAFVQQGVKYGDSRPGGGINYPFVTLYDQQGVCGDKSVLLSALLRRLGYASSLFYYYPRDNEPQTDPDNPHHMVSGILTADRNGNYGTSYANIESSGTGLIGEPLPWPKPKELILTSHGRPYSGK